MSGLKRPLIAAAPVALAWLFSTSPLRDAATLLPVSGAALHQPPGYLLGAPLFGVWDTLTLLAVSQHYAVLATLVALYVVRRAFAARTSRSRRPGASSGAAAGAAAPSAPVPALLRRAARELLRAALALVALLAFYAAAALIPRPMTALRLASPDHLAVDFHSHTNRSHDGMFLFTAARNRAWHEAAGFHAAYITDHYNWDGVAEALPANPARAGEGTVLLSGVEVRLRDRHTNLLGGPSRYLFALDSTWHHLDPDLLAAATRRGAEPPTMLYTIPAPLDRIVPFGNGAAPVADDGGPAEAAERTATTPSPAGVVGVELSDGAPRGLEQQRSQRARILALADSMDLAVVAGSNNHGWSRTAAAWSVMRIPGWREMSPERLGRAIEAELHRERRRAVAVVERRVPYHDGSAARVAATAPVLAWEHLRMLTVAERLSWLAWCGVWAVVIARRARGADGAHGQ